MNLAEGDHTPSVLFWRDGLLVAYRAGIDGPRFFVEKRIFRWARILDVPVENISDRMPCVNRRRGSSLVLGACLMVCGSFQTVTLAMLPSVTSMKGFVTLGLTIATFAFGVILVSRALFSAGIYRRVASRGAGGKIIEIPERIMRHSGLATQILLGGFARRVGDASRESQGMVAECGHLLKSGLIDEDEYRSLLVQLARK